ncbi:hypothetical protein [Thermococcus nautili]|uniref:Protein conserved in hyperthermophilic archaea n=1 Tax=Thermococcus nautili TaxID=195522 RepID=U3RPN2_9EURY|nr:hypothetical protein [Thermococcus nautili]AGX15336.1 Protein conserved in hyperthermophilic archaea [Thermococcus nautili]AHL23863.1 protein conserved in hyperthermophilic archaea [Thermococcus nautili]
MSRSNIYLGRRVKDTGKKGLDNLREVRDICKAILADFKRGRIPYRTAMRRLVFLRTTVIKRSEKLVGKKRKAYAIVRKYEEKLRGMRK